MRIYNILKALAQKPYIKQEGDRSNFHYRIWSNGMIELNTNGVLDLTGTYVGQAGGVYNYKKDITLPFNIQTATANATAYGRLGTGIGYCSYMNFTSQNNLLVYVGGNDNSSTMHIAIQIVAFLVGGS